MAVTLDIKNRAQLRDSIRRGLSQVPPIDDGVGIAGAQPTRNPYPTNAGCNEALDFSVAWFSRKGKLADDPVPQRIIVAATTDPGPWHTSLRNIAPAGSVNDVLRVAWVPSSVNQEQQLTPNNRQNLDRTRKNYMTQDPGTPECWWVEGGELMVWPGFASGGSLIVMLGNALWRHSQNIDGETIDILPTDYHPLIVAKAISLICATQPEDEILKLSKQAADMEIADGLPDFLAWARRRNRAYQPHLVPKPGRSGMLQGRR